MKCDRVYCRRLTETFARTQVLPSAFRLWGWKCSALFVPKGSFLIGALDVTFKQKQISLTTYDALAKQRGVLQTTPPVDFARYY
jgi:hypothetical protein